MKNLLCGNILFYPVRRKEHLYTVIIYTQYPIKSMSGADKLT